MSDQPIGESDSSNDDFVPPYIPPRPRSTDRFLVAEGVRAGSRMVGWLAVGLFALFWCSGITTIGPGEAGLVLRCGRLAGVSPTDQVRQPGLLLALPYPIDQVIRVPVKQERELRITSLRSDNGAKIEGLPGYALSGDQGILEADMTLKYRVSNPIEFTFANRSPERILRDAVIGAATKVIAQWRIDDALRLQRVTDIGPQKLARTVRREAQLHIGRIGLGVELAAIEFREIQPPAAIADAFQAVQSERIAIETRKREAEGFASRIVPAAEAESNSLIQMATRQATDLKTRAEEEVALFNRVRGEYVRNPELVWNRLHLETLERLMKDGSRFRFVDPGARLVLTPGNPSVESRDGKPATRQHESNGSTARASESVEARP